MNQAFTSDKEILLAIQEIGQLFLDAALRFPYYTVIFLTEGSGTYFADVGKFPFKAPVLLFSTPLQRLAIVTDKDIKGYVIHFHGDFYCIEYHKSEVACNGLLFNSIYVEPSVSLNPEQVVFFDRLCKDVMKELAEVKPDENVLRSYLQLFLAKSSGIKLKTLGEIPVEKQKDRQMEAFADLIEKNFLTLHKPAEYAALLQMPTNTLSKKSQLYFSKSPSNMIQERLIMEAKKKLHLTRQSIKEIAFALNFSDEYYFSRFFKKFTKFSPQGYREATGISIVADLQE